MFRDNPRILHLQLSIPSLLGDTPEEAAKRRNDTEQAMDRLFRYATWVFGEPDARRIWTGVSKNRRGAPKGSRDPERDRSLLDLYDQCANACTSEAARARLPGRIGRLLAVEAQARYGNSSEAITKHLRRLLHERHTQQRIRQEEMRVLFGDPPHFMSSLIGSSGSGATVAVPIDAADGLVAEGRKST